MGFRKQLNENEVEHVVGGSYEFDWDTGIVTVKYKRSVRKFQLNAGVTAETISLILTDTNDDSISDTQNNNALIDAIKNYVTELSD